ncbi:MAG TPA: cold shock domain-containing protein [Mycobacterium sp.]
MRGTGTVIRFDRVRGYGFIAPDTGGDDVFLHANDLGFDKRHARDGVAVTFEVEEGDRGKFATHVRLVDEPPPAAATNSATDPAADIDDYYDVLTNDEFRSLLTETLLKIDPPLNSKQILLIRSHLEAIARKLSWIEP